MPDFCTKATQRKQGFAFLSSFVFDLASSDLNQDSFLGGQLKRG